MVQYVQLNVLELGVSCYYFAQSMGREFALASHETQHLQLFFLMGFETNANGQLKVVGMGNSYWHY